MPDEEKDGGTSSGEASQEAKQQAEGEPTAEGEAQKAQAPAAGEGAAKPAAEKKPDAKAEEPARPQPPPGGVANLLKQALPDIELEAYQGITDVIVEISRDDVPKVMPVARDDPNLDLKFLRCLFGVDHEDDGMDVVYQLGSLRKGHDVVIKTRLPKDDLRVASVSEVWRAADWHERETRDMFGIEFEGHAHLVPLLLPEDMTDHFPLRKSNVLAEIQEWQADLVGGGAGDDDGSGE